MTVLEGDPVALQADVDAFAAATAELSDAIAQLEAIAITGRALALDAFDGAVADATGDMRDALKRYSTTTGALRTYAVALADAHARAGTAVESGELALSRRDDSSARADAYRDAARRLEEGGADPALVRDREDAARYHQGLADQAFNDYQDALGRLTQARQDVDDAARTAIAAIELGFEGTSDGVRDHVAAVGRFFSDAWSGFSSWVSGVFSEVVKEIRAFTADLLDILSKVVLILAVPGLIVTVLALALSPVGLAMVIDVLMGGDFTGSIDLLKGILLIQPMVYLFVQMRILGDVIEPDPAVERFLPTADDPDVEAAQVYAVQALRDRAPQTSNDLIEAMAEVDQAGGDGLGDGTGVVSIRSVVGADGVERWIVTLPSTQDWGLPGDEGATNDLDGNLALFLGDPALRTQYERAVDQALANAGVSPEDPILFTGFSQGGIMAAHYAAYRADDYNIQGILTAGSPIDTFPIDEDIAVVQVQHTRDAVHQLDGVYGEGGMEAPNRVRIVGGEQFSMEDAHNADNYATTLGGDGQCTIPDALFEDFLVDPDDLAAGTVRTESVQYAWSE